MQQLKSRFQDMKILLILLAVASLAVATDKNVITFTNLSGRVYENVLIIKTEPDGFLWLATNGSGGGKVQFKDLPLDLQNQFGYEPSVAAKFEQDQKARAAKQRATYQAEMRILAEQQLKEKEFADSKAAFFRSARRLNGKVIGKHLKQRVLVLLIEDPVADALGVSLTDCIRDYRDFDSVQDGQRIDIVGYDPHPYNFTNIAGFAQNRRVYTVAIPERFQEKKK